MSYGTPRRALTRATDVSKQWQTVGAADKLWEALAQLNFPALFKLKSALPGNRCRRDLCWQRAWLELGPVTRVLPVPHTTSYYKKEGIVLIIRIILTKNVYHDHNSFDDLYLTI